MSRKNKLRVVVCRVGKPPELTEIYNWAEPMQEVVGGYFEVHTLSDEFDLICNEEGRLRNLPANRRIGRQVIVGDFFVTRVDRDGGEYVSVRKSDLKTMEALLGEPVKESVEGGARK